MNERIKKLFEQVADNLDPEDCMVSEEFLKSFAELIVRECADVAKETRWAVPPSQEQIARGIQQHFGVKE